MKSLKRLTIAGAIALSTISAAQAQIVQYSYTAPDGKIHTKDKSANFANIEANLDFYIGAGLDRKVRLTLKDSAGTSLYSNTSKLISASDLIDVSGKKYYGVKISVPNNKIPNADGQYTAISEVISADTGKVVSTDTYTFNVDKTKPTASNIFITGGDKDSYGQSSTGDLWDLGLGGAGHDHFTVNGIHDKSGIKHTKIFIYHENGTLAKSHNMGYDPNGAIASAQHGRKIDFFPATNLDETFQVQVEITDNADNTWKSPKQAVRYDNIANSPTKPVGVYNPNIAAAPIHPDLPNFVPYTDGMEVYTNPIELIYKIPKNNWHTYNKGGIKLRNAVGENRVVAEDSDSVYLLMSTPHNIFNHNFIRWVNFGEWGRSAPSYNLSLASGIPSTPKLVKTEFNFSDVGWHSMWRTINVKGLPVSINKVRITAKPQIYKQIASYGGSSCEIPIGQISCVADINLTATPGTSGYWHQMTAVRNEGNTLRDMGLWGEVTWNDYHHPTVETTYDESSFELTAYVNQPAQGGYQGKIALERTWLEDKNGNILKAKGGLVDKVGGDFTYKWDLSSLPEGEFQVFVLAKERHGGFIKKKAASLESDKTPPNLEIKRTGGSKVTSLDDLLIQLRDEIDDSPKITGINLKGGPTKDNIQLSWREETKGMFRLEYPIMFPSLEVGQGYLITVSATDKQGNTVTKEHSFEFEPKLLKLSGGLDGKISIPAVTDTFTRVDGSHIILTEPVTMSDGSAISGRYDVIVSLRSDSEIPLMVNGRKVEPGATLTVLNQHDFSMNNGQINIPLAAAADGKEGTANLLVMTTAPNSPVLVADVKLWSGTAKLVSKDWEFRQVIDPIEITPTPDGIPCRFTSDVEEAKKSDIVFDPICLIEWQNIPDETTTVVYENTGTKLESIEGQAFEVGEQEISYNTYLYNSANDRVFIGSGVNKINVVPALGANSYGTKGNYSQVSHTIEDLFIQMNQGLGDSCIVTMDKNEAINKSKNDPVTERKKLCYFEWTAIPEGLMQSNKHKEPALEGSIPRAGEFDLGWRVSVFGKNGGSVVLSEETMKINSVVPSNPKLSIDSRYIVNDNLLIIPPSGGYIADAKMTAEGSEVDTSILRDGKVVEQFIAHANGSGKTSANRRIINSNLAVWEKTSYEITSHYDKVKSVSSTHKFDVVAAPDLGVGAVISSNSTRVVDTETLPVNVQIKDKYNFGEDYTKEVMGEWNVRLIQTDRKTKEVTPLTEFVKVNDEGSADFNIALDNMLGSVFISAEASLISPIKEYSRTEISQNLYLNVLYGGEVESEITSRKIEGKAPMNTTIVLKTDRSLVRSMGKVVWKVSSDGGNNWVEESVTDRSKATYRKSFEAGKYLVKADVYNINSDAVFTTKVMEITAYNQPNLKIKGDSMVFLGDSPLIQAEAFDDNGNPMPEAIIQWSFDKGQSFVHTGTELNIENDIPKRKTVEIWARSPDASADSRYSYSIEKVTVDFKKPRGPRISITGDRLIEAGKEYTYKADLSLPYRRMDADVMMEGEFLMPDGRIVKGLTATYTPTELDSDAGKIEIKYTAWIKGKKEQGAVSTATFKPKAWQYVWPRFGIYITSDSKVAPSFGTIRARALAYRGELEDPVYTWTATPSDGLQFLANDNSDSVRFDVLKEGSYTINMTVKDARGNVAEASSEVAFSKAEPFVSDMKLGYSNKYMREPMDVFIRPIVTGGHPRDKAEFYEFRLNGEVIPDSTKRSAKATLEKGNHTLKLTTTTRQGTVLEKEIQLTVAPNQPPVCELVTKDLSKSWRITAKCHDNDGKVRSYDWSLNGEPVSISAGRITVSKSAYDDNMPSVSLFAIDDAGDYSAETTLESVMNSNQKKPNKSLDTSRFPK